MDTGKHVMTLQEEGASILKHTPRPGRSSGCVQAAAASPAIVMFLYETESTTANIATFRRIRFDPGCKSGDGSPNNEEQMPPSESFIDARMTGFTTKHYGNLNTLRLELIFSSGVHWNKVFVILGELPN